MVSEKKNLKKPGDFEDSGVQPDLTPTSSLATCSLHQRVVCNYHQRAKVTENQVDTELPGGCEHAMKISQKTPGCL